MPSTSNEVLLSIPRRRRAEIRKALTAEKAGALSIRYDGAPEEFYRVYAQSLRDHGTPALPPRFIEALYEKFSGNIEIVTVESRGKTIAVLLSFRFRDRYMPYFIGGNAQARSLKAFDYLHYSTMCRAVDGGISVFDFGRSKNDSPHYQYKTYWGFEPKPLTYQVSLITAKSMPNVNPNNPKFSKFATAWKRLPSPIANALGPVLARNFA